MHFLLLEESQKLNFVKCFFFYYLDCYFVRELAAVFGGFLFTHWSRPRCAAMPDGPVLSAPFPMNKYFLVDSKSILEASFSGWASCDAESWCAVWVKLSVAGAVHRC